MHHGLGQLAQTKLQESSGGSLLQCLQPPRPSHEPLQHCVVPADRHDGAIYQRLQFQCDRLKIFEDLPHPTAVKSCQHPQDVIPLEDVECCPFSLEFLEAILQADAAYSQLIHDQRGHAGVRFQAWKVVQDHSIHVHLSKKKSHLITSLKRHSWFRI